MRALPSEDLEVFWRIKRTIGLFRLGEVPDSVERAQLAWILTRVLARLIPILTIVDGSFAGLDHSWLLGPAGSVIDVCPPEAHGGPLIYSSDRLFESREADEAVPDEELTEVVSQLVADFKARTRVIGM